MSHGITLRVKVDLILLRMHTDCRNSVIKYVGLCSVFGTLCVGLCSVFGWYSAVCSGGTLQCVREGLCSVFGRVYNFITQDLSFWSADLYEKFLTSSRARFCTGWPYLWVITWISRVQLQWQAQWFYQNYDWAWRMDKFDHQILNSIQTATQLPPPQ